MKTLEQLQKEFNARLCRLNTGAYGIRAGIHVTVSEPRDYDGADGDPVMDFIASDETVDRYNECIKQDGWLLDNFLANPVVPDCHDYSSIGKILGRDILTKGQQIQGGKLCTRVLFCTDNPMGNLAYKMAVGGFVKSQSVGFIPLEWTNGNDKDAPDRTYTKCELLEKSLVVVPANPGATIGAALKSGALAKSDIKNVVDLLKQFCSEEKTEPGRLVSASAAGNHDAYLLQIARGLNQVLKRA
jgi:Caudovirus prohead serine protease